MSQFISYSNDMAIKVDIIMKSFADLKLGATLKCVGFLSFKMFKLSSEHMCTI